MDKPEDDPQTREVHLVVRHLKLEGIDSSNERAMLNEIETTYGVDSASYEAPSSTLHIGYDAMECDLEGLEQIILKHGGDVSHDWNTAFKEGYYRFLDSNIRDHVVNEVWGGHTDPSLEAVKPEDIKAEKMKPKSK
ncbi:cation transporter [Pseudomaricurvus sp.]|uniref:cation transporter n=1 Tax=Pseudomaricurvus sp. TaxID=2004510 RepID=UPI003F6AB0F4